jgi:hypothetical protein
MISVEDFSVEQQLSNKTTLLEKKALPKEILA